MALSNYSVTDSFTEESTEEGFSWPYGNVEIGRENNDLRIEIEVGGQGFAIQPNDKFVAEVKRSTDAVWVSIPDVDMPADVIDGSNTIVTLYKAQIPVPGATWQTRVRIRRA